MSHTSEVDTAEFEVSAHPSATDTPPPYSPRVEADLAGLSDQGKVRSKNEDHFLTVRFGRYFEPLQTNLPVGEVPDTSQETGYGMTVADGIGGSAAGEVASRMAIHTFVNTVLNTPDWVLLLRDNDLLQKIVKRATERYHQVNRVLSQQAEADPALRGFGTTLTVAWSLGKHLLVAHLGDCRAYLFRKGQLLKLTADHTVAQELANDGLLAQEEVATHCLRHVLTRALGPENTSSTPDVRKLTLLDRDCLLLCTDGLTDMVPEVRIAAALDKADTSANACQHLVDAALEAGGKDNITVVVARYRFV